MNVTALARGSVSVSGQSVSGTITGVGGVSASGDSITANLVSANVTGATSGQSGLGQGGAANGASQGLANSQSTQAAAATDQIQRRRRKKERQENRPRAKSEPRDGDFAAKESVRNQNSNSRNLAQTRIIHDHVHPSIVRRQRGGLTPSRTPPPRARSPSSCCWCCRCSVGRSSSPSSAS